MPASTSSPELLSIRRVQDRTGMGRSNIYRLMVLGLFPRPIQLGGSKWIASEVDEFIQQRKDERDRQHGQNNFAPRPSILSGLDESLSHNKPRTSAGPLPSTIRMLGPELCDALRMLNLDIPEVYLDPETWTVSLAVIKIELSPSHPTRKAPKGEKRKPDPLTRFLGSSPADQRL